MRSVAFVLPMVLPSLNTMLRQHWSKRRQHRNDLVLEVIVAIGGPRYLPRKPFAKARVSIVRHSPRPLDTDGAYASVKNLVDVMCAGSSAHPYGLGIIEDDAPSKCELVVSQQRASRGEAFTAVRVEELA